MIIFAKMLLLLAFESSLQLGVGEVKGGNTNPRIGERKPGARGIKLPAWREPPPPRGRGEEERVLRITPDWEVSQGLPEHRPGGKVEINARGSLGKMGVGISAPSLGGCLLGNPEGGRWEGI